MITRVYSKVLFIALLASVALPASNIAALSTINKLTNSELILEDKTAVSGFPKTGLYVKRAAGGIDNQFYIGYTPSTSATTSTTPRVLLTGQEKDKELLVFSLNGQSMNSFKSFFDGQNNSANKLFINGRGAPIMTLTGKGYIGIGTTTPLGFFHVQGNMYVDGIVNARTMTSSLATDNISPLVADFGIAGISSVTRDIYARVGTVNGVTYTNYGDTGSKFKFRFGESPTPPNTKDFVIPHPNDKQRYLVHSVLEGPENGVRYRGTVTLKNGKAQISLPDYVSEFTDPETATLHLHADNTGESLRVIYTKNKWLDKGRIRIESENPSSDETVSWTVQLTRTDIPPLQITPPKNLVHVDSIGPYKSVKGYRQ